MLPSHLSLLVDPKHLKFNIPTFCFATFHDLILSKLISSNYTIVCVITITNLPDSHPQKLDLWLCHPEFQNTFPIPLPINLTSVNANLYSRLST